MAVCSPKCAIERAQTQRKTKERKEHREAKEKLKSRQDWMREAQTAFNAYRREITKHLGCISCGTHNGKMNGGHYRSVGSSPETRFVEENVWCQCERCNSYLSGNLTNYRIALVKLIGISAIEKLEGYHSPAKYTIEDLKTITKSYRIKLSEFKRFNNE